ncbi:unnamed protein product [Citrullus colocynthis]|uniref:Uncharacterized protein n=1 Tax=Citrullus colocynthis TaxID=252529 RepID=A0ABP0YXI2_9ROSI
MKNGRFELLASCRRETFIEAGLNLNRRWRLEVDVREVESSRRWDLRSACLLGLKSLEPRGERLESQRRWSFVFVPSWLAVRNMDSRGDHRWTRGWWTEIIRERGRWDSRFDGGDEAEHTNPKN